MKEEQVYIIAEVGSNHCGDIEQAYKLIESCADAGVDAVKFQSWQALQLQNSMDVQENGALVESAVVPILQKYELPDEWHPLLYQYCNDRGVDFLSTPFDVSRARLLRDIGVSAIKISSGDLTYDELLEEVAEYSMPIILSTGMANLGEIEHALNKINHGNISLLHCVGAYPPALEDANLRALTTLSDTFRLPIGISDHYMDNDAVLAAVAMGASIVEKHVTMSRSDGAPDSPFALEMLELKELVEGIRKLEILLGDGIKRCQSSEEGGLVGGRRCLFAARNIESGEVLSRQDIAIVRPSIGMIKPRHLKTVLGKVSITAIREGEPLDWRMLSK